MVKKKFTKFDEKPVLEVFESYPKIIKNKLLFLRELIFDVAEDIEGIGQIQETLKWGQPSYFSMNPKTGTTIRIGMVKNHTTQYAMYVHCQTSLIQTFMQMYGDKFSFSGKRAILFNVNDPLPEKELGHCIALALTYHLHK